MRSLKLGLLSGVAALVALGAMDTAEAGSRWKFRYYDAYPEYESFYPGPIFIPPPRYYKYNRYSAYEDDYDVDKYDGHKHPFRAKQCVLNFCSRPCTATKRKSWPIARIKSRATVSWVRQIAGSSRSIVAMSSGSIGSTAAGKLPTMRPLRPMMNLWKFQRGPAPGRSTAAHL